MPINKETNNSVIEIFSGDVLEFGQGIYHKLLFCQLKKFVFLMSTNTTSSQNLLNYNWCLKENMDVLANVFLHLLVTSVPTYFFLFDTDIAATCTKNSKEVKEKQTESGIIKCIR